MGLLAGKLYDPTAAVSKATTSNLAMTAIDTTNLRLTFTAPANGIVLVRQACVVLGNFALYTGSTYVLGMPQFVFGVLEGSTIQGRSAPRYMGVGNPYSVGPTAESMFLVTGLTAGSSHTWDAAYAVSNPATSTGLRYGGPNDALGNPSWGGYSFEIWST